MPKYQVFARRYRPQRFKDVVGQEAIVATLKNAIKYKKVAHAYLFCGSRGTGKTTLARLFAKALNCQKLIEEEGEPCNQCSSCKEIAAGSSLDVLEIDGASNRGIDDIRQINETVGYASSSGKYKIYIIDEVHMLTKEAFNALLKTLEEPPLSVKFFFATTEPHKVLPTILSRCQRFNLNRIPQILIEEKLKMIAQDQGVDVEEKALQLIASMAEGALRDAESLFDQILTFHGGKVTLACVEAIFGVMPRDSFFALDYAGKKDNLAAAFEIAHDLFSQGKDLSHFVEGLCDHFRTLLIVKVMGKQARQLSLSEQEKEKYEASAKLYSKEQCLANLDFLLEAQGQMRFALSERFFLESILMRIIRSHKRLPIDVLVRRLAELEKHLFPSDDASVRLPAPPLQQQRGVLPQQKEATPAALPLVLDLTPTSNLEVPKAIIQSTPIATPTALMMEDPTPSAKDLGLALSPMRTTPTVAKSEEAKQKPLVTAPVALGVQPIEETKQATAKKQSRYDTLLQFAAVELEGTIQKGG